MENEIVQSSERTTPLVECAKAPVDVTAAPKCHHDRARSLAYPDLA